MSRLLTMSELYRLLLECDLHKSPQELRTTKNSLPPAMPLNDQSPILWTGPQPEAHPMSPPAPAQRHITVAADLADAMDDLAEASGLSAGEAWSEAAQVWIAQRRHDMQELTSPAGRELSQAVQRVWNIIDAQMLELRDKSA